MKTIQLIEPVTLNGKEVEALTMKRPTIGDEEDALDLAEMMGKANNPLSSEMCLFSILCNVGYDDLRSLPSFVHQQLRSAYQDLTSPKSRPSKKGNGKPETAAPVTGTEGTAQADSRN